MMMSRTKPVFLYYQSIQEVAFRANRGTLIITNINAVSEGKSLATNFDDLCSSPGIHMVEEDNQLP